MRSHIVLHFYKSPAQKNTARFSYLLLYEIYHEILFGGSNGKK